MADRWTLLVPDIVKEFWKDGVRYYKVKGSHKPYDADTYDKKLAPKIIKKRAV